MNLFNMDIYDVRYVTTPTALRWIRHISLYHLKDRITLFQKYALLLQITRYEMLQVHYYAVTFGALVTSSNYLRKT